MSLGMSLLAQISRIFSKTAASPPLGAGRYLALIGASALLLFSCGLLSQEVLPSPSSVASPNSRPPSPTSTLVRVTPPPSRTPTVTPLDRADATGLSTDTDVPTGGATSQTATPTILPLECLPEKGDDEYGLVKWVSGGDIIAVDLQGRQYIVRYLGIRSPDYSPFPQYMGPPAATQNASLVQGQVVRLVQDRPATDSLGRLLRYVLVYDTGLFVNYELVRQGLAQVETSIPPFACQGTFSQVQQLAQVAKLGLWAPTPTRLPTRALLPTLTWTLSPSGTPTPTPTGTLPTPTFTPTGTLPTPTGTLPTSTPTPTGTLPTPTGTLPTSTPTPTITPSPTSTGTPPTSTASPSPTGTV